MPKLIPTKEDRKIASDYGYEIGERWRRSLIIWIKNIFKRGRLNGK